MSDDSKASYWVLVLSDWRRSDAMVAITLKSGTTLGPGKVTDNGATLGVAVLHDSGMVYSGYSSGWRRERPERKWNVDLDEIAGVEATATR
jgi:hypothetical protein